MRTNTGSLRNAVLGVPGLGAELLGTCDADLAGLVRRVRRRPGALQRMRVDQASAVLRFLLATQRAEDLLVASRAVAREERDSMWRDAEVVRRRLERELPEEEERTCELLRGAGPEQIAQLPAGSVLHPGTITHWALQSSEHTWACAHLAALRREAIVRAVLDGELDVDLWGFLQAACKDARARRETLKAAGEWAAVLDEPLFDVLRECGVHLAGWRFGRVEERVVRRCVAREGADAGIDERVLHTWVAGGVIDGWRLLRENLSEQQSQQLAHAGAVRHDAGLVNAALAGVTPGGEHAGVNLGEILDVFAPDELTGHALAVCASDLYGPVLLAWAARAQERHLQQVAEGISVAAMENVLNWEIAEHRLERGGRELLRALCQGRGCGIALRTSSEVVARTAVELLRDRIGDDAEVWRVVLTLAGEWTGTMDELVGAARACSIRSGR